MEEFASQTPPHISTILREYRIPILFLVFSAICIALSLLLFTKTLQTTEVIQFSSDNQGITSSGSAKLMVDVSGAVLHPGVYAGLTWQ